MPTGSGKGSNAPHSHQHCHGGESCRGHDGPETRDLRDHLRRESLRVTGPRQAILAVLQQNPHPLTNREIFAALRPGQCDLATVYRSLHLLEDMGLVARFDFGDGVARFEIVRGDSRAHHHHLVCTSCTTIVELEDCLAKEWEERIARASGFTGVTHKLEFFGLCPSCQDGEPGTPPSAPKKRVTRRRDPSISV
ncbi:MAG: transcriptional repressor [Verrucomicrobiales bacterium]|nr:transcriptional repressor [Verrucomicrobiales bacterium]